VFVFEVRAFNPRSHLFQILYTIGGKDNVELARQYFAQSLELNGRANNLRALYGIILVRALFPILYFPEHTIEHALLRPSSALF
jgi:hypothetical protein